MPAVWLAGPRADRRGGGSLRGVQGGLWHRAGEDDPLPNGLKLLRGAEADRKGALEWLARFLADMWLGQPKPMPWARRR